MGVLKSQVGLIACAVYSVVTVIAVVRDLTRKPGLLILIDDPFFSTILTQPGLIILGALLELLGVKNPPYWTRIQSEGYPNKLGVFGTNAANEVSATTVTTSPSRN